ncbi:PREDICTED: protein FAM26F [Elephantulus edwardii]|uniref:protein FAM26F n=1 Tax=Elephantulus edwardii TaxID=28737 RepID=UPI0003F08031|nr:PREDICTED: protein FAM26F [Elephantulus edwardii]
MDKFQTVLDQYLKHHSALSYGLVTLLTAGGERIFSTVVFACPCSTTWNLPYGLVFLLVPALALFLLGYMLSARTWRLLTGCCARGGSRGCGTRLRGALVFSHLSAAAALAPLTWVAVALLGGAFYECAASGSAFFARRLCNNTSECMKTLHQVPCNPGKKTDMQDLLKVLKAQSQVLGWILIAIVIIILLVSTAITRCMSPVSFMQLKFWKIYLDQEQQIFKTQATQHATELAKENVRCFFEGAQPKEYNTPSIKDWQQISSLYVFNPKGQYYSMLHKYVNRQEKNQSIRSLEGDAVIPVLGFVDSPGINTTAEL